MKPEEEWKPVNGYPKYLISSLGRIKSFHQQKSGNVLSGSKNNMGYTRIALWNNKEKKSERLIHKLVAEHFLEANEGDMIDHINRNTTDNCVGNLRISNHSLNAINSPTKSDSKHSKFKGVGFHKRDNLWRARICRDGKRKVIGYFKSEKEAAKAYDKMARSLFGDFAHLNFNGN